MREKKIYIYYRLKKNVNNDITSTFVFHHTVVHINIHHKASSTSLYVFLMLTRLFLIIRKHEYVNILNHFIIILIVLSGVFYV